MRQTAWLSRFSRGKEKGQFNHVDGKGEMSWFMDGGKTRLPFRWPQQETGKTAASLVPSRPVDT
jgi:hypothetical protein